MYINKYIYIYIYTYVYVYTRLCIKHIIHSYFIMPRKTLAWPRAPRDQREPRPCRRRR